MSDNDSFTEITRTSWLSRIGGSILGFLFGIVLIVGSGALLFWNEGRAVQTAKSLAEGSGLVIDVGADTVEAANQGKLIHVSGDIKTASRIADPQFGVSADGVRLVRSVEMYQWKEEKHSETHKNLGGSEETTTTYTYSRAWSPDRIDSTKFRRPDGHDNPDMRYRRATFTSKDATLGAFHPGAAVLSELPASEDVALDESSATALRSRVGGPIQLSGSSYYLGSDPGTPRIGDLRVSFQMAPQGPASIVAQQQGTDFAEYQTQAGDRLLMVKPGTVSAAAMFKSAADDNRILTWILRAVGAVAMWIGFALLFGPISTVADVIPIIGDIIGAGTTLAALAVTFVVAPVIIAVAWLWYRPVVSIIALLVGALLAFGLRAMTGRKASARAEKSAAAR